MAAWFAGMWVFLYKYHYGLGLHTARLFHRLGRWLYRVSRPLRRRCRYLWLRRVVLPAHRFRRKLRNLGGRMGPAYRLMKRTAKEKNLWAVVPCFLRLCRSALRHYWDELASLGRILGPVAAVLALTATVGTWAGVEYHLTVNYQGKDLGVVANADVYEAGAAMAKERVINVNNDFKVSVPVFTMTIQGRRAPMSAEQVCDEILRASRDDLAEATGLYVDGRFVAAMESREEMDALLKTLRQKLVDQLPQEDASDRVKVKKVEFVQKLKKTDGLYPVQAVCDAATLESKLDTLTVKVIKTVTTDEVIKFKTNTVYKDTMYTDETKVITEGKDGEQEVVTEETWINGKCTKTKVVKRTVTKKAVTKVVHKGTKKRVLMNGMLVEPGDGVAHGNMLWPVPICHNMSRGFKSGHKALDICNGPVPVYGHPAVAADGGTVVHAGWYYDYGYHVRIDHGNGLVTTYSHLSAVKVVKGQKVSRGQTVGLIGSTGWSSGPHLHFEVIKNGVKVDPLLYVKP
ncbi:MAG: hypothetical protein E7527_04685 [Ruminococcaceae bacterium]|nr:hypothetical protein [Oscillospiraceae bacterium]